MSSEPRITIVQPRSDGSVPLPPVVQATEPGVTVEALQERADVLHAQVQEFNALLDKPLSEILAEREKALEAAAAWDAFGAMWVLSQRAMRRVALDLAEQQGVSEAQVVARAMRYANEVLNGDGVDLGGSIAPAQLAHIARHTARLRTQFRPAEASD